jgi:hypothetical protein
MPRRELGQVVQGELHRPGDVEYLIHAAPRASTWGRVSARPFSLRPQRRSTTQTACRRGASNSESFFTVCNIGQPTDDATSVLLVGMDLAHYRTRNGEGVMGVSALETGSIPVSLAARLAKVPQARLRAWLGAGRSRDSRPPLRRDLEPVAGRWTVSFFNLLEARVVDYFRSRKIPLSVVRAVDEALRRETNEPHPLLLKGSRFRTGLRRVFIEAVQQEGDRHLIDVVHRQYALFELLDDLLDEGLEFDPSSRPVLWTPRAAFPEIVLDPRRAFGKPVVRDYWVPTAALRDALITEGSVSCGLV